MLSIIKIIKIEDNVVEVFVRNGEISASIGDTYTKVYQLKASDSIEDYAKSPILILQNIGIFNLKSINWYHKKVDTLDAGHTALVILETDHPEYLFEYCILDNK